MSHLPARPRAALPSPGMSADSTTAQADRLRRLWSQQPEPEPESELDPKALQAEVDAWRAHGESLLARCTLAMPLSVCMASLPPVFSELAAAVQGELWHAASAAALEANPDVLRHVLSMVDVATLCRAAQVRRAWRDVVCSTDAASSELWRDCCTKRWPAAAHFLQGQVNGKTPVAWVAPVDLTRG
jgi:hypothetical protein